MLPTLSSGSEGVAKLKHRFNVYYLFRYCQALICLGLVATTVVLVSLATGAGHAIIQTGVETGTGAGGLPVLGGFGRFRGFRRQSQHGDVASQSTQPDTLLRFDDGNGRICPRNISVSHIVFQDYAQPVQEGESPFHLPLPPTSVFRRHKLDAAVTGEIAAETVKSAFWMERPSIARQEDDAPTAASYLPTVMADEERRRAVKAAFEHSWFAYKKHAWGKDLLRPVSNSSDNGFLSMAISVTDSLSTLAIMGMEDELQAAVSWVETNLVFDAQEDFNVFESTIRVIGGLTSTYFLTNKRFPRLLSKAQELADGFAFAFDSPTGIPFGTVGLRSKKRYNPAWVSGGSTISEIASLQLELESLAHATGKAKYAQLGRRIMAHLMLVEPVDDSLYPMYISPDTGRFLSQTITFGARGDSLYEYLLKQYVLAGGLRDGPTAFQGNPAVLSSGTSLVDFGPPPSSPGRPAWQQAHVIAQSECTGIQNTSLYTCTDAACAPCPAQGYNCDADTGTLPSFVGTDTSYRAPSPLSERSWFNYLLGMYFRSMAGMEAELLRYTGPSRLAYIRERLSPGRYDDKMDHLVCFVPGMLALGSNAAPTRQLREHHMKMARAIMSTCIRMYDMTPTGLAPEITRFPGGGDPVVDPGAKHNLLRPETVESLLILYRHTGDTLYRDAGWRIFQAFEKWSKVSWGGYSTLRDVTEVPPRQADVQESFWLAETLKYLYLLFSEDSLVPLDKWVFNTEAHPLPVFS